MKEIITSSPAANGYRSRINRKTWPWDKLDCGQSFKVQKSEIKFETLRPLCSKEGMKFDPRRHFKAIEHDDCYEVARVE